jgi:hypothetical protein
MTFLTPRKRTSALLLSSALLLAACGGSSDRDSAPVAPPTGSPPPVASTDTFFQIVLARISSLLDNAEPVEIDAIPLTVPETTEPEPIPAS